MASLLHEGIIELLRRSPELAAELLRRVLPARLRRRLPRFDGASLLEADLSQLVPVEARADAVIVLRRGDVAVQTIVVEVQLGIDGSKRKSWPVYLAAARAKWGCPCELVVVAPDSKVAAWAQRPIAFGLAVRRSVVQPWVVGRRSIPRVTRPKQAVKRPELAVLSALAHGNAAGGEEVVLAALHATLGLEDELQRRYADIVMAALSAAARNALEELMQARNPQYHSEFARKYFSEGRQEGRQEGRADAVLEVLALRGISLSVVRAEQVRACREPEQLHRWMGRALVIATAEELFSEDVLPS